MLREDWSTGWQQRAACRGDDSVFFFAPSHFEKRAEKNAREAVAKSICAGCPVREPCLEFAMRVGETHGVWGGLNEMERRAIHRMQGHGGVVPA